jgi:hypothetical protein
VLNVGGPTRFPARFAGTLNADINGSCVGPDCAIAAQGAGVVGGFPCVSALDIGVRNLDGL